MVKNPFVEIFFYRCVGSCYTGPSRGNQVDGLPRDLHTAGVVVGRRRASAKICDKCNFEVIFDPITAYGHWRF